MGEGHWEIGDSQILYTGTSELIPKKTRLKMSNITFDILPFSIVIFNFHPEYFGVYFSWWNHQMRFKIVHSNTKNEKSRVRQSQVYELRTTNYSSALKHVNRW